MYNALAVVAQLWKGSGGWGIHSTTSTTIVAVIFLVLFLALYPRGEALEMHPGHWAWSNLERTGQPTRPFLLGLKACSSPRGARASGSAPPPTSRLSTDRHPPPAS